MHENKMKIEFVVIVTKPCAREGHKTRFICDEPHRPLVGAKADATALPYAKAVAVAKRCEERGWSAWVTTRATSVN